VKVATTYFFHSSPHFSALHILIFNKFYLLHSTLANTTLNTLSLSLSLSFPLISLILLYLTRWHAARYNNNFSLSVLPFAYFILLAWNFSLSLGSLFLKNNMTPNTINLLWRSVLVQRSHLHCAIYNMTWDAPDNALLFKQDVLLLGCIATEI